MKTKHLAILSILILIIILLFSILVLAEETTIIFSNKGLNIYKYEDGRTALLSEVVSFDIGENDDVIYNLPGGSLTLGMEIKYEGKNDAITDFKVQKGIEFSLNKEKYDYWKYDFNLSKFKSKGFKTQNINSIELKYKDIKGYKLDDLHFNQESHSILFPDNIKFSFEDIAKDLKVIVSPTGIVIYGFNTQNTTKFIDKEEIILDPIITMSQPDTEIMEDSLTRRGITNETINNNYGGGTQYTVGGDANLWFWAKFNTSLIPTGKFITDAEWVQVCNTENANDGTGRMEIYNSSNYTWTEETITFNNQPSSDKLLNYTTGWVGGNQRQDVSTNVTLGFRSSYGANLPFSVFANMSSATNGLLCDKGATKEGIIAERHYLEVTYSDSQVNYTSNVIVYVNNISVWNQSSSFTNTEIITNLSQAINKFLETCTEDVEGYCTVPLTVHSDSVGRINLTNINVYFNITEYNWNTVNLTALSTYKVRIRATDGSLNSNYDSSDNDFIISHTISNDTNKFIFQNNAGNNVVWFGDQGNIVLKGTCSLSANCIPPSDSFIFKNALDNVVAHIDSNGNLCIEIGDCSDHSASCNPSNEAFIIQNLSSSNMSYIDFTGDLCLTGTLTQNGNP